MSCYFMLSIRDLSFLRGSCLFVFWKGVSYILIYEEEDKFDEKL